MAGISVIFWMLKSDAALTALVPAERVCAGELPDGAIVPAISLHEISRVERHQVSALGNTLVTSRVQATAIADTYPDQERLVALMGAAVANLRGTVNGIPVDSIMRDIVGPDMRSLEPRRFMKSRDYIVKHYETH
jgi:hypothetical protein